jgi:inner membrane protein
MDSVSQALWGALSSQATQKKRRGKVPAWLMGLAAGTLPDLDSFIRSSSDPLLATVMHRHFTHSIFFIPVGALITWLIFWPFFRNEKENYRNYYLIALAGYGTHWILDVLTSYGTLILWPINNTRYALDWLSIVDPLLTIPWLIALILFLIYKNQKWVYSVLIYSVLYTAYCGVLHSQARAAYLQYLTLQKEDATLSRERIRLLPSLGNSFWYRAISVDDQYVYATGIFVDPLTHKKYFREGEKAPLWKWSENDFQNLETQRQIKIWSWFVDDYLYLESENPPSIGDGRYSTQANEFNSLWVLILDLNDPKNTLKTAPDLQKTTRDRSPFEGYSLLFERKDLVEL